MRYFVATLFCALAAEAAPAPLPRPGAPAGPTGPEKYLYERLGKGEAFTHSGMTLRAKRVVGRTLLGVTFQLKTGKGEVTLTGTAEEAEARLDKGGTRVFLRLLHAEGRAEDGSRFSAGEHWLNLALTAPIDRGKK